MTTAHRRFIRRFLAGQRIFGRRRYPLGSYDPAVCRLFRRGRDAIDAACRLLDLGPGDAVLVPAWICKEALWPYENIGCRLDYYLTDPLTFDADVQSIAARITGRTRLIHVINHFGHPQPWDELGALRRTVHVPLLEDNAFSLFSSSRGRAFGQWGDIAVFSLYKSLPIGVGGMLRINDPALLQKRHAAVPARGRNTPARPSSSRRAAPWAAFTARPKRYPPPLPDAGRVQPPARTPSAERNQAYGHPMPPLPRLLLQAFPEREVAFIAARKREMHRWLSGALEGHPGVRVLHPDPPAEVVPFCLSMLLESRRDEVLSRLGGAYPVMAWPTLPSRVIRRLPEFPDVDRLGRQLLQITFPLRLIYDGAWRHRLAELVGRLKVLTSAHP